ncbi:nuclear receptor subfamily 1 group I member 3 isoform X3 [Passer montanus]|uniref:nuclear receptor subfamily 1 group I member 3 isoform X3 n=1 Tax=Passer montanus TaxID=9160 RepID=UPI001961C256|nr:nuclear receptor subfamily 1 group I member 3 isoform X3 [Passer montanus]
MEGTHGDGRRHAGTAGDTRGPELPSLRGDSSLSPAAPGDTGSGVSLPSPPGTERSPRDPPGDTEPDGDKVCAVCGDRANGYHFHVMSCEGCKGFFRRSIIKGVRFTCPLARRCPVTKAKRRQCQACRLQKCLDVGMRRDTRRAPAGAQPAWRGCRRGGVAVAVAVRGGAAGRAVAAAAVRGPEHVHDPAGDQIRQGDPGVQEFAAGGADLAAERSHAGHLRDPLQHRLQPRHQGLGVRPALLHHPRRGPGGIPAGVPGASAQVPREPAAPAAARGRVRPAAGHAALLARPRRHRPARRHRPVPGAGGADPAELHRAPAPPPRGQVPVRQAAAAADGAADADGGEHAADPAHPGPVGHDAAALRDHQLSAAPVPPPGPQVSPPAATRHRVKLLYLSGLPGVSPQGN